MTTKEEALAAVALARESYKDFVAKVDEDLRRERQVRLAKQQGTIYHLVAEAHTLGASIADLKRAYGTKDYSTIKRIIESLTLEQEVRVTNPVVVASVDSWYDYHAEEQMLSTEDTDYYVIELDDGEDLMLEAITGNDMHRLDGLTEHDAKLGYNIEHREIFETIRRATA